jgi:LacI family transcriptional regulator/LacI family purine nucleotide synthesis repressor
VLGKGLLNMSQLIERNEKRVTIQDIARSTGVSVATVSGAFSGKRRMSVQTREAVLKTAREMGFEPNPHAQRLRNGGCTNTVGLLGNLDLGVATMTLWEIRHRLDERGFKIDDHILPLWVKDVNTHQTEVLRSMCRHNPQAILFPYMGLEPGVFNILEQYVEGGGILVCWTSVRPVLQEQHLTADRVLYDTEEETYLQTRHLIELGHRKLGLYSHSKDVKLSDRLVGFRRALREAKIKLRRDWVRGASGYEDAGIKHAEHFLALKERPTGVCIINDNAAAAFVHAVMRDGLQVPRDVSVIGCDDTAAARAALVPLTTMRRPIKELSRAIVNTFCDRLNGVIQGPPVIREIKSELIVRSSTAAPHLGT